MFLETLKPRKIELSSIAAKDALIKRVTFFTDFEVVASMAAEKRQARQPFTAVDAERLPLRGLVYAHVEIRGKGDKQIKQDEQIKNVARYSQGSAYLVLQFGEEIVEALSTGPDEGSGSGRTSLLTGEPRGFNGSHSDLEFAFELTEKQKTGKATVVLIDPDGNQHQEQVNFAAIFR